MTGLLPTIQRSSSSRLRSFRVSQESGLAAADDVQDERIAAVHRNYEALSNVMQLKSAKLDKVRPLPAPSATDSRTAPRSAEVFS